MDICQDYRSNKTICKDAAASLEQDSGSSDAVAKIMFKVVTSETPSLDVAGTDMYNAFS